MNDALAETKKMTNRKVGRGRLRIIKKEKEQLQIAPRRSKGSGIRTWLVPPGKLVAFHIVSYSTVLQPLAFSIISLVPRLSLFLLFSRK